MNDKMGRRDKKKHKKYISDSNSSGSSSFTDSEDSGDIDSTGSSTDDRRPIKHKKRRKSSSSKSHKHKKDKKKDKKQESISEDDYFKKSTEFRSWLSNERGIYFSDLSSSKSHKLFSKFVRKWNSGQLKKIYYKGIQSSSLEHSSQTDYKWKLTGHDDVRTGSVRDQVSSWTSGSGFDEEGPGYRRGHIKEGGTGSSRGGSGRAMRGPEGPPPGADYLIDDPHLREEAREEERRQVQRNRKEFRKHHEMVMDELLPKATGHQARIEKRRMLNQQRREREVSPDIDDSSLMGSSGNQIKDRIKSKHTDRVRRAEVATQKISDYREKEKSKVAAILEMARANKKEGSLW